MEDVKTEHSQNPFHVNERAEDLVKILKLVRSGEIVIWSQLEIMCDMMNIDVNKEMFNFIFGFIFDKNVLSMMYNSMVDGNDCDKFLSDFNVINSILMKDNTIIHESYKRFDSVEFLNKSEIRNPGTFIKYFLKNESYTMTNLDSYWRMFKLVLNRTEMRSKVNLEYSEANDLLKKRYDELNHYKMFIQ